MTQSPSSLVVTESIVVEASVELTWTELVRACDADVDQLTALVDEGVLVVEGVDPLTWRFADATLRRARVALRLTRDLQLNPPGTALALDLLDEIERLRSRLRQIEGG